VEAFFELWGLRMGWGGGGEGLRLRDGGGAAVVVVLLQLGLVQCTVRSTGSGVLTLLVEFLVQVVHVDRLVWGDVLLLARRAVGRRKELERYGCNPSAASQRAETVLAAPLMPLHASG